MRQNFSLQGKASIHFYLILFLFIQIFVFSAYTYPASINTDNTDRITDILSSPFQTTHESMNDMGFHHSEDPGDFYGFSSSEKASSFGQHNITMPAIKLAMNEGPEKGLHITVTAIKKGDVNSDGKVSIVDALLIARFDAEMNMENVDRFNAGAGDVDEDGSVNIEDALYIARYVVHLDVPYLP